MPLRICNNGVSILNADRVAELVQCMGGVEKVAEFPVTVQIDRMKNYVVMDVLLVCVSSNDIGVIAMGEPPCQFLTHTVGFLRCYFTRQEGLAHMICDHIVFATLAPGTLKVFPLCQQEFGICSTVITGIAGDQLALLRLVRILGIVENVTDGCSLSTPLPGMKRYTYLSQQ